MLIIQQLVCKGCWDKISKVKIVVLKGSLQCCGVCICVYIIILRKLNLVFWKVVCVKLMSQVEVMVYIFGEGYNLQEYLMVLVCGGWVKDLFGVCYKIICGLLDMQGVKNCKQVCSCYGVKKEKG